jgi:molecular chaperone GrpE
MKKGKSAAAAGDEAAGGASTVKQPTIDQQEGKPATPAGDQLVTTPPAADQLEPGEIDPCQAIKETLAAKEADFAVLSDKYLRLAAEFDNFRRRSQKEKEALYSDSIFLVIREFLPVLDNIDRAGAAVGQVQNEEARKIGEGITMVQKQVEQVLARLNVSQIECVGKIFDPQLHEAVMHVEDEQAGASVVVEELQKGYSREDRIIRHSMVKVAN